MFMNLIFDVLNKQSGISSSPGGGGYSHILAIWVCAAEKRMVFKPFGLV